MKVMKNMRGEKASNTDLGCDVLRRRSVYSSSIPG